MIFWGYLVGSFIFVAFGQTAWIPGFSIAAAAFGYALFWRSMLYFPRLRDRFCLSVGWFAAIQAVQLSWLTSMEYMGPLILVVYAFLIFAIGLQFGLLSLFFSKNDISLRNCFAISGSWVLLEWARIFFFSGFTWNPVGLALADSSYAIQMAALFGVYGLSFWVIFTNSFALYAYKSQKRIAIWASLALFPYLFGWVHQKIVERNVPFEQTVSAALVQTGLLPEQKDRYADRSEFFIPPLAQWERICKNLQNSSPLDLIVLPESAITLSAYRPFYSINAVIRLWFDLFGRVSLDNLPLLKSPLAAYDHARGEYRVTNAYIAQGLANHFNAHVISGFDDQDGLLSYNAAFHFIPKNHLVPPRYEKRILVPVAEYIPFPNIQWISRFLIEQFGIGEPFDRGKEAKLFFSPLPIGVSICLEETYSNLVRDLRQKGARLLINISNDVWFPQSRLPIQHFQHGRIRSAENGVCSLRACNTGITGGIDCFGKIISELPPSEQKIDILYFSFPLRSFQTLYTWWGDHAILLLSAIFVLFGIRKKKLP